VRKRKMKIRIAPPNLLAALAADRP